MWIVTKIELDLCFYIIYQHTKCELNQSSLSKVIERTPNFGRTHARTGVTLNVPPPFFEWRGHKNFINNIFYYKRALRALVRSPEEKVNGNSRAIYRGPLMLSTKYEGCSINNETVLITFCFASN